MRIHHLAMRTRDVPRLEAFYAGVLGLKVLQKREGSVWLEAGEAILMLESADPGEPEIPANCKEFIAFRVDAPSGGERGENEPNETSRWRNAIEQSGCTIEAETQFTLYFRDPDGRRIGLSHYRVLD